MSFTPETAFQPRVWNNRNNDTQNIAGRFYSSGRAADCSAGFLCARGEIDADGVSRMTAAANGSGTVYICNPSDVQRLQSPNGNVYAVGANTLGLGIPAGVTDTFTEAVPGEIYSFGTGNFSDLPEEGSYFCRVSAGALTPGSAKPSGEIYFEVLPNLGSEMFTEGNRAAFGQVTVICRRG